MKAGDYDAWAAWVKEKWPDQNFSAWDRYREWLLSVLPQVKRK